jgi:hypothetical protein
MRFIETPPVCTPQDFWRTDRRNRRFSTNLCKFRKAESFPTRLARRGFKTAFHLNIEFGLPIVIISWLRGLWSSNSREVRAGQKGLKDP